MTRTLFHNRADAGRQLAEYLAERPARDPLVLAIPRGGVAVAAPIARALGAELDIVLSRKLRAPGHPELAIGAVAEDGRVYLNQLGTQVQADAPEYLTWERGVELEEIARQAAVYRAARPRADIHARTVIVADDGIATGSTMIAALQTLRAAAADLIAAAPVGAHESVEHLRAFCDHVECPHQPHRFLAVGPYYQDFEPVSDETVVALLAGEA